MIGTSEEGSGLSPDLAGVERELLELSIVSLGVAAVPWLGQGCRTATQVLAASIRFKRKGPAQRATAPRTLDKVRLSSVAFVDPAVLRRSFPPFVEACSGSGFVDLAGFNELKRFRLGKHSFLNLSLSFAEVA